MILSSQATTRTKFLANPSCVLLSTAVSKTRRASADPEQLINRLLSGVKLSEEVKYGAL